eukprot:CAMPEP_0178397268 /NCGR_PEP_ID=MMETSP0689_2-20121128/14156_1 /TAXON_ID=160604 /ORGANISM="Amphidinium massartii, Strain CS-259" /LENGTH=96 /DNA_ID=CAMNT_0020017967 /DNA_START=763 /DNA_END=1053 /DNA_ORIENTATION=-
MRGATTQCTTSSKHVFTACAIWPPPDQTSVGVYLVVIDIGEVYVVIGVNHQPMSVDHLGARRELQQMRHVLISVIRWSCLLVCAAAEVLELPSPLR